MLLPIPDEVMHHLLFFGTKFFRETVEAVFPAYAKDFPDHFLSLSFAGLTTYADYRGKKKVSPHLKLSDFLRETDMVRVAPVQAPKNFTADLTLRKGSSRDATLPVVVQKTDLESDYPYLTRELAELVGKNQHWTARAAQVLGLKGDPKYHQPIRTSQSGSVHRYSNAAVERIRTELKDSPPFNPYSA